MDQKSFKRVYFFQYLLKVDIDREFLGLTSMKVILVLGDKLRN